MRAFFHGGQLRLRAAAFLPREPPRDITTVGAGKSRPSLNPQLRAAGGCRVNCSRATDATWHWLQFSFRWMRHYLSTSPYANCAHPLGRTLSRPKEGW